jgi:hypothetical protein
VTARSALALLERHHRPSWLKRNLGDQEIWQAKSAIRDKAAKP